MRYHLLPVTDSSSSSRERIMQSVITNNAPHQHYHKVIQFASSIVVVGWEGGCNMITALSFTLWNEDERGRCRGRRVREGGRVSSLERN